MLHNMQQGCQPARSNNTLYMGVPALGKSQLTFSSCRVNWLLSLKPARDK